VVVSVQDDLILKYLGLAWAINDVQYCHKEPRNYVHYSACIHVLNTHTRMCSIRKYFGVKLLTFD